jgi:hypothetical protein
MRNKPGTAGQLAKVRVTFRPHRTLPPYKTIDALAVPGSRKGGISMRKNWIIGLMGAALVAVVPATALAHGPHAKHHAKRHHRVHARVRHLQAAGTGTSSTSPTPGSSTDSAGTVTSFDGTTLVVTLADHSTVSGAVTNDTELSCESSSQTTSMQSDMRSDGGHRGGGDQGGSQGGSGDQSASDDQSDRGGSDEQGDNGDDDGNQTACTTANLTLGTGVHEADLKISSAGSVWEKVDLITG